MSPIEHIWDVLDRQIRQRVPVPTNIQQLRTAIEEEWTNIPQATIDNLINSIPVESGSVTLSVSCLFRVSSVVNMTLTEAEVAQLRASADTLWKIQKDLKDL
uniref:Uncharacterized protein n=1 Tax=Neogobius melanostomus TaxID=47308 RepID=A0A8C6S7K6_9GOBI